MHAPHGSGPRAKTLLAAPRAAWPAALPLALFVMIGFAACSRPSGETPAKTEAPAPRTTAIAPAPADPAWGYEEVATGPANWGKLSAKFVACAEGTSQSPIDIVDSSPATLPVFRAVYAPSQLRIVHHEHMSDVVNTGHSIQVNYPQGDTLVLGEDVYALAQYHFHSPSEHTVKGKQYPMEMHLVHKSADGRLAVVAVLIEEGAHNAAFDPVWANLPKQKGVETHLEHVLVDMDDLLPADRSTYRYEGSLTTPPCSEGVMWMIFRTPVQLSPEQVATFRAVMLGNNRPVQALHGRKVATDKM